MIYERFTELAKRAVRSSQDAAMALGHDHIGTEHLLLGLAATAGTASEVLRAHGVELDRARAETVRLLAEAGTPATGGQGAKDALSTLGIDVTEIQRRADDTFGPGSFQFPRPAFTTGAKQTVQRALGEAKVLEHERIDTEHLLLGLLGEGEGVAIRVLTTLGADPAVLRHALLDRASPRAA